MYTLLPLTHFNKKDTLRQTNEYEGNERVYQKKFQCKRQYSGYNLYCSAQCDIMKHSCSEVTKFGCFLFFFCLLMLHFTVLEQPIRCSKCIQH